MEPCSMYPLGLFSSTWGLQESSVLHVIVQLLSRVQLFATPRTAARQAFLSFTISWSLLKLMSIESVMPSNHLILCRPLLLPSIFSSISSFPMSWFFASDGRRIGASALASVLPMNSGLISSRIDWFDLLQTKGLSRVFSNTIVWKHAFFSAQPSLWSTSHMMYMWDVHHISHLYMSSHIHTRLLEKP